MEAEDIRVDYPDDLALFLLKSRIGLKKSKENLNFWALK